MRIRDHLIAPGQPTYLIAELSGNHNGDKGRALALIQAAAAAGADAVKLQTYTADTITIDGPQACFRIADGPWAGRTLHDLYSEASTPWAWHEDLFAEAQRLGLTCFSTPFDASAVAFLQGLGAPAYKIASFELIDLPLIARIAATGMPVIASTGMADLGEIGAAVRTLQRGGCPAFALLACVSAYPCAPEDFHLANIPALAAAFACPAGLSDHSPGHVAAVAATTLGARIIEKHLCLRRADGGPDAAFSLEPHEFAELVRAVRQTEAACSGGAVFGVGQADAGSVQFRRSLFAVRDIPAGTVLGPEDVRSIRPGHGLPPADLPRVLGRTARVSITRGTPLSWSHLV